jgi:gas vesicle protein
MAYRNQPYERRPSEKKIKEYKYNYYPIDAKQLDEEDKEAAAFTADIIQRLRDSRSDWKERCDLIDDRFRDEVRELQEKLKITVGPVTAALICRRLGFEPTLEFMLQ